MKKFLKVGFIQAIFILAFMPQLYGAIIYVDVDATGSNIGTTWANAFSDFSLAFIYINPGDEVWIAEGTYKVTDTKYFDDNVKVYGGFVGNETSISQRNYATHPTILSGDIGIPNFHGDDLGQAYAGGNGVTIDGIIFEHFYEEMSDYVLNLGDNTTINNCIFRDISNAFVIRGYFEFENCLFVRISGETISFGSLIPENKVTNCTFYDFSSAVNLPDFHANDFIATENTIHFRNCILWNPIREDGSFGIIDPIKHIVKVSNCIIEDNANYPSSPYFIKANIIDKDPLFQNTTLNNFKLDRCSPAVNFGNSSYSSESKDLSNTSRIAGDNIDLGCYEYPYPPDVDIVYVDKNATGANNGTSWLNAYTNLNTAIMNAECNSPIWVSQGTYYTPGANANIVDKGLKILGGFNGTQGAASQRDWELYPTIISANFQANGIKTDNAAVIFDFTNAPNDSDVVIDGFTIRGSYTTNTNSAALKNVSVNGDVNLVLRNNKFIYHDNQVISNTGNLTVRNCLFAHNSSPGFGQYAISDISGPSILTVSFCTFFDNDYYNVIGIQNVDQGNINNCIFWSNNNSNNLDVAGVLANVTIINNTTNASMIAPTNTGAVVENAYNVYPDFTDTLNDDFTLYSCSPVIDLGATDVFIPDFDLAKNPRVSGFLPDLGCYEFDLPTTQTIIYVDASATGANNGTSWPNAYKDLQDAINASTQGNDIWVAKGTYYPFDKTLPFGSVDPTASFKPTCGVSLYGGFDGYETSIDQRTEGSRSILSGQYPMSGSSVIYHVVRLKDWSANSTLDGFNIEYGYASNAAATSAGGGIWASNAYGKIKNCYFFSNGAEVRGAQIFIAANSDLVLNGCIFREPLNGTAPDRGGQIAVDNSEVVINKCKFDFGVSDLGGTFLYSKRSNVTIKNSGIHNSYSNTTLFELADSSQLFMDYSAVNRVIGFADKVIDITDLKSTVHLDHSLVFDLINQASDTMQVIGGIGTANATVSNCVVETGWPTGTNIINADPLLFDNPLTLNPCSPAIDAGFGNADIPNEDFYGNSRSTDLAPDWGPVEFQNNRYTTDYAGQDLEVCASDSFTLSYKFPMKDTIYTPFDGAIMQSGVMFNIDMKEEVSWTGMRLNKSCPLASIIKIYYTLNGYDGKQLQPTMWTLVDSLIQGNSCPDSSTITFANPVILKKGQRYGVYAAVKRTTNNLSNYILSSNVPTKAFGDTLISNEIMVIYHGVGTKDTLFKNPQAFSRRFEGGFIFSNYDSLVWCNNGLKVGTGQNLTYPTGIAAGTYHFEAKEYDKGTSCAALDTVVVTSTSVNQRDECVNATMLSLGINGNFNNQCATTSAQSSLCFTNPSKDVWFKFQGTSSGKLDITVKFVASITGNFNPKIAAYKGTCNSLMSLACINDHPAEMDEVIHLSGLNPNNTYYLSVDGFGIQEGKFKIQLVDPCEGTYSDYAPLETLTGLCKNQAVTLTAGIDSSFSLTSSFNFPQEHYGLFFDIVAKKGVKIRRIASAFKELAGTTFVSIYFKKGSSVGYEGSAIGWTGNGIANIQNAGNTITEIPIGIEEILMPGDTLGIYLYTNTSNAAIRMNGIGGFQQTAASQNDDISIIKGRYATGPQFNGLNTTLSRWLIGRVIYERIEQVQWLKNGVVSSSNFNYTFSPVNNDEIVLRLMDQVGCRTSDTTVIKAEGKIVTKEMGKGLGSLSSVLNCAVVGDTLRFHAALNGKTIKMPKALEINVDNALIGNVVIEGNAINKTILSCEYDHHFLRNTSPFDVAVTFKNIQFIKGNGAISGAPSDLFENVINSTLVLDNCIIENSGTNDNVIQNNGKVVLKNVLVKDIFANKHLENHGQVEIQGNVLLKE